MIIRIIERKVGEERKREREEERRRDREWKIWLWKYLDLKICFCDIMFGIYVFEIFYDGYLLIRDFVLIYRDFNIRILWIFMVDIRGVVFFFWSGFKIL